MKRNELKGIIVAQGKNYLQCANELNLSHSGFTNKINFGDFTTTEARKLTIFLNIKNPLEIFLELNTLEKW